MKKMSEIPLILSDDEDSESTVMSKRRLTDVAEMARTLGERTSGTCEGAIGSTIRSLREDKSLVTTANEVLRRTGLMEDEQPPYVHGYTLTINDNVHVLAQWPQFNVYRVPNNAATYGSLTLNEFCMVYTVYIKEAFVW